MNIREDPVKKIGLRHNKKRIGQMVERQVFATKAVTDAPVSMLKEEEFKLSGYRPPYKNFNEITSMSNKNMDTNIHPDYRQRLPTSRKVFITPMNSNETVGAKWGGRAASVNS